MKRHLYLALSLAFLCGSVHAASAKASKKNPFSQVADLGNVMYVGDSITHGTAAASYRWPLFKIWVDNGISQKEVGVHSRNHSGGVQPNTPYGSGVFLNVHSSISSERAYEIAGRINKSGRLEDSNIFDWLGLNKEYSGSRCIDPATEMPATFFLFIGTNDTLSDAGRAGIHTCIDQKEKDLLGRKGDMETIVRAMREANPKARIVVTTIPTWGPGRNNNAAPEDYAAIMQYNEKLKTWAKSNKVAVVELNRGMIDVPASKEVPFVGLLSMFGRDRLHPSAQGDLIIAGNIARQLGYAGRTAGLKRRAAAQFPVQKNACTINPGSTCRLEGSDEAQGGTVELCFTKKGLGNGARGGWEDDKPMELRLATTSASGTLSLSEGYISWNGEVLYSTDMSRLNEPIRLAYVPGKPALSVEPGFYVWVGDMLIGEALGGEAQASDARPEVTLTNPEGCPPVRLTSISADLGRSWAPSTKRFSAANPTYEGVEPPTAALTGNDNTVTVRGAEDVARLSSASGAISGGSDTGSPRVLVFDHAPVSARALNLEKFDEVHITNGSAVVLSSLGGARKLVVDATSRLGLAAGDYETSVLNSGTIILPAGASLSLRAEGTDENETGSYIIKGGKLNANNVRMSNNIRVESGEVSGLGQDSFRGKLEKK